MEDVGISQKTHKPEEFVAKLRQVDVLMSQGRSLLEAVRAISVTPFTYYIGCVVGPLSIRSDRWRNLRA